MLRLVRGLVDQQDDECGYRIGAGAKEQLHQAAEDYLLNYFRAANRIATHGGKKPTKTLMVRHIQEANNVAALFPGRPIDRSVVQREKDYAEYTERCRIGGFVPRSLYTIDKRPLSTEAANARKAKKEVKRVPVEQKKKQSASTTTTTDEDDDDDDETTADEDTPRAKKSFVFLKKKKKQSVATGVNSPPSKQQQPVGQDLSPIY